MARQSRSLLVLSFVLYLRLFIPLVQCEITSSDWNSGSDTDSDNPYRESLSDKESAPASKNEFTPPLWAPIMENGAEGKDLMSDASLSKMLGYPIMEQQQLPASAIYDYLMRRPQTSGSPYLSRLQALQRARKLQQLQQQHKIGMLGAGSGSTAMDTVADDFAQAPEALPSTFDEFIQPQVPAPRMRTVEARPKLPRPSYFLYNLKRGKDSYQCHFKLCQVGVSGKRLSM